MAAAEPPPPLHSSEICISTSGRASYCIKAPTPSTPHLGATRSPHQWSGYLHTFSVSPPDWTWALLHSMLGEDGYRPTGGDNMMHTAREGLLLNTTQACNRGGGGEHNGDKGQRVGYGKPSQPEIMCCRHVWFTIHKPWAVAPLGVLDCCTHQALSRWRQCTLSHVGGGACTSEIHSAFMAPPPPTHKHIPQLQAALWSVACGTALIL